MLSDQAKDAIGIDKDFYKQRLLDKFKVKSPKSSSTDLLLYDNPEKARKIMVRSFFKFYLKSILTQNKILTESYLATLRDQYNTLNQEQKVTFTDIKQTLEEMEVSMEVDSAEKQQLVAFLMEHTNIADSMILD